MLEAEAKWVCQFFTHSRDTWIRRGQDTTAGYASYALKQADMWETFGQLGREMVSTMAADKDRLLRQSSKNT